MPVRRRAASTWKPRSIADQGRPSGRGLLICQDRLGGSNSPKSHPHTWNPGVVDPQLPRNLEQDVSSRSGAGTLPARAIFSRATSVQDALGVTRVCPRVKHIVTGRPRLLPRMYHASGYLTYLADMVCKIGTRTVELTSTNQLCTRAKPPGGLSYSVA